MFSYFVGDKIDVDGGDPIFTYFTGDNYQYMVDGVYDTIRFTPTGGIDDTIPEGVYNVEREYYMCFRIGDTSESGNTITLQSNAVDRSQYKSDNSFIYGLRNIPNPFTGVSWETYDSNGVATTHRANALTGTTYSILRKSYVKVYESDVTGFSGGLESNLLAFYKQNGYLNYKLGYSKYFFSDPVIHFYHANDSSTTEVFTYGSAELKTKSDGIHLLYDFAKDLAGYPVTGEFIARLTAKDPCGNMASIYILLCIDVKDNAAVTRINPKSTSPATIITPASTE
jgi:hypothetical protein